MGDGIFGVDWGRMLLPDTPVVEIFVRGSLVYLTLFVLLRLVLKREAGAIGISDLLVVVLLADAAQNAMADDYTSLPDGLLLVGTIVFWSYAINWLGFRFRPFERLVRPGPLPLVRNGQLMRRNMRQELLTEAELMSQIRLQGCDDLASVKLAQIEPDGRISVISHDGAGNGHHAPERRAS